MSVRSGSVRIRADDGCRTEAHPRQHRVQSGRTVISSFCRIGVVSLFLAESNGAHADVMRWSGTGQDGQQSGGSVLRYDAAGVLIQPQADAVITAGVESETDTVATLSAPQRSGAVPENVLSMILLTSRRYQDHPVLTFTGLSSREWTALFEAMIRVESAYNMAAVSPAGARGLAQLMPATAISLGVDADTPLENLDGGARYLLAQLETFGTIPLALAAYNAGPEAVRKYDGIPPYPETRNYVLRVIAAYEHLLKASDRTRL
jgi:Transglycosylase SLT domain